MKTLRTIMLLGTISFLIAGCTSEKPSPTIEVSCDEFNQDAFRTDNLTVDSGQLITIKLCSNPSTGFAWSEMPEFNGPEILSQESHAYSIQEENGTPLPPGTPGIETWTFTAVSTGESQLVFEYSRNWEGGEKGVWTFTLDITVK